MSVTPNQQIKRMLNAMAEYYQQSLSPTQIGMYAEVLENLPLEEIGRAMVKIRENPNITRFPLPALIIREIKGDPKDEALEASNRIVEALGRFGYTNPDKAKDHIGSLGWRVVEREGGWASLCERVKNEDLPILKAQWRELAAATLRRSHSGRDSIAPPLAYDPDPQKQMSHISSVIPKLEEPKDDSDDDDIEE